MGNSASSIKKSENQFNNFYEIIDYIATYYILTMDFKSLSKLSEKAYCDNLVVLTSDIIERYFNDMDITFLAQRIKDGVEVNELLTQNVRFINKDSLESLDVSNDVQKSIRKKRVCIGIAKFYVKIAHIFAAIVMTINPVYTYKDATGQTVKTTLLEKDTIPKGVDRKLYKLNICDNRIRALKRGETIDEQTGKVTIQPKVCDMNMEANGTTKTLAEEPGIQELMRLYLDDNYDYSNGNFTGMSKKTEQQFRKDLQLFYTAFTGEQVMPDNIQKFSDIKLRDYSKKPGCQLPNNMLNQKYTLNKKDKLFVNYANNIKNMIQRASDNQYKLLEVINLLFTYVNDPYTGKRVIRINPKLTDSILQSAVVKTRKYIIDLYVRCEADYVAGVQMYEAIVESKIVETTQNQISNLKKEANRIITETKMASKPTTSSTPVVVPGPNPTLQNTKITTISSITPPPMNSLNGTTSTSEITQTPDIIPPAISKPTNTSQLPSATPNELPTATTNELPTNTSQLPTTTSQLPTNTSQLPTTPSQLPSDTSNELPSANMSNLPSDTPSKLSTNISNLPSDTSNELPSANMSNLPSDTPSQLSTTNNIQQQNQMLTNKPEISTNGIPSNNIKNINANPQQPVNLNGQLKQM